MDVGVGDGLKLNSDDRGDACPQILLKHQHHPSRKRFIALKDSHTDVAYI